MSRLLSRRGILALVAALVFSAFAAPQADAAKKKAPNFKGHWHGVLNSNFLENFEIALNVNSQNKKTGKIKGTGFTLAGQFEFSAKIKPNGKLKGDFDAVLNEEPVTIQLDITVARDGKTAEGTFKVVDSEGQTVDEGTVEMEKEIEE